MSVISEKIHALSEQIHALLGTDLGTDLGTELHETAQNQFDLMQSVGHLVAFDQRLCDNVGRAEHLARSCEPPDQICVCDAGTMAIFDGSAVGNESDMLDTFSWPSDVIVS